MSELEARIAALPDKSLLLLDDDQALRTRMGRALEARGFQVTTAESVAEATQLLRDKAPAFAVLDMRLEDGNGLKVVEAVREKREDARIVMLTGYGAIATAVAAVKAGAVDYLSKPADADDVVKALLATGDSPEPPENPMSADRVRWEHIQRVYELCDHNVSETARRLGMHRRTLQRILAKRAPREGESLNPSPSGLSRGPTVGSNTVVGQLVRPSLADSSRPCSSTVGPRDKPEGDGVWI